MSDKSALTKAGIVEKLQDKVTGYSKKQLAQMVDQVFNVIKDTLVSGEERIKLPGFGNFVTRMKSDRVGRNPQSGARIVLPARRVLTFRPSQLFRKALNS